MINTSILTISDRSFNGERDDLSGPALASRVADLGWKIIHTDILPDDTNQIQKTLIAWVSEDTSDLILTTGGTGFSPRDVTPEATLAILEKLTPGISEAMRFHSLKFTPHAMLSRAVAGIRKSTLIVNLPGSPKAAIENLQVIEPVIPHAVDLLRSNPGSESGHRI